MNINNKRLSEKKVEICFIFLFIFVFCFLFWRVKYGIANIDESYYVSISYRIFQGDSMLVEEWGITQLSAFLMYPVVSLYMLIFQNTEGILLAARYFYVCLCSVSALFVFYRLKKIDPTAALVASVGIQLYAPFGIAATSYNSLCILLLVVMFVLIATEKKFNWLTCYLIGWIFAASVLCCPYLILPLVLYVWTLAVISLKKRNTACIPYVISLQWKIIAGIIFGGGTLALLFCIYVFRKATLSDILVSIPYIVNDGSHPVSFLNKCFHYVGDMVWLYRSCVLMFVFELVVLYKMMQIRTEKAKQIGLLILLVSTVICEIIVWHSIHYINFLFTPINFLGLLLFVIYWDDPIVSKLFYLIYLPGWIYSVCLHFSSNQTAYAISSAMTVSVVGSIVIIRQVYTKLIKWGQNLYRNIAVCTLSLLFGILLLSELEIRYTKVFWDTDINTQTVYLSKGPEKGIYVSQEMAHQYNSIYDEVHQICDEYEKHDMLFVTDSFQTLYYIFDDIRTAAPSSWNVYFAERMDAYYAINPHKKPAIIYCKKICDLDFLKGIISEYEISEETDSAIVYIRKGSP